jgi:hypothetical protein
MEKKNEEELLVAMCGLSVAAVERCAVDLDARDWERVVSRLREAWRTREASGEDLAEACAAASRGEADAGTVSVSEKRELEGWRAAAAAARLALRLENLPVSIDPPDPKRATSRGDVVPFAARGAAARAVADRLSRADWPVARAEVNGAFARALMASGAELRHAGGTADVTATPRLAAWYARRGREGGLWADVAAFWCSSPNAWTAADAAAPWDAMDRWEEARCGAIAALYQILLCADGFETESIRGSVFQTLDAMRRCAYALLCAPSLVKPAVFGLDCAASDVDAIEAALRLAEEDSSDASESDDDEDDVEDEDIFPASSRAARRAGVRDALSEKLKNGFVPNPESVSKGDSKKKNGPSNPPRVAVSTLLCWGLLLRHLSVSNLGSRARNRFAEYATALRAVPGIGPLAMDTLRGGEPRRDVPGAGSVTSLPKPWRDMHAAAERARKEGTGGCGGAAAAAGVDTLSPSFVFGGPPRLGRRRLERAETRLRVALFRACLSSLPASTRAWFSDLGDTRAARTFARATAIALSPAIRENEFEAVERAVRGDASSGGSGGSGVSGVSGSETPGADSAGAFAVKVSRRTGEISATYSVEDAALELRVKLPDCYPLVQAALETGRRVGVSEARARKWTLAAGVILRHQNGAVSTALGTWLRNVEKEFAGVEPCPICYLVIQGSNHSLPKLKCGQCRNTFHDACLYKWFASSSKSTCPLCQTPWGAARARG